MALESFSGIWSLDTSNPLPSDDINQGDDHIRGIKASIRQTFPALSATVSVAASEINHLAGVAENVGDVISRHNALSQSYVSHIAYGIMSLAGSTTEFSASTSLSLFTGFDVAGVSTLTTLKTASGAIAVSKPGHYEVDARLAISASTAAEIQVGLFLNDTDTGFRGTGLVPAQGRSNISVYGMYSAGASDEFRIRLSATVAKLIVVKDGQFKVVRRN